MTAWADAPETPCLYDVVITHSRRQPVLHRFRYRSYLWLTDIDHPPRLPKILQGLARFRSVDHVDIRSQLADSGVTAERILMLASPRTLGYVFNPLSVYWCYGAAGDLVANVAEVHNTYGGRHAYVLTPDDRGRAEVDKKMYVSPFYPVDGTYEIRISGPAEAVTVSVTLHRDGSETFGAAMRGTRRPATAANMALAWLRFPWAPLRVRALIQWQGLRLWKKGLEVQPR